MNARNLLVLFASALLLLGVGCTDSKLDDADTGDVVLQVSQVQVSPINGALDATTGICSFTITESTATVDNVPKVEFPEDATGQPAQDVLITGLTISYAWDDGVVTPPSTTSPRVVVPVGASNDVKFNAIPLDSLINAPAPRDGHSAEMTMLFEGETFSGDNVSARAGAALIVNSCQ